MDPESLPKRLRDADFTDGDLTICDEAADEIDRLRSEVKSLREANNTLAASSICHGDWPDPVEPNPLDCPKAPCNDCLHYVRSERDELRRELRAVLDDWNSIVAASGSKTNGGLVGHIAALRRDAERYRWLRGAAPSVSVRYARWRLEYFDGPNGWNELFREQLDAALDTGMGS